MFKWHGPRMETKLMEIGKKEWFYILIISLIITNLVILLNIPFLRQIFGFLFLTLLPGLLILEILKLNKIDFLEKFILSWGLSISFLMFFGLLLNNLSLSLGYETPLATIPLLISFNIAFIVLAIIGYKIKTFEKSFIKNYLPTFNLSISEKAFLIVPILFPALSILGMYVMNTTDSNIILMFLLPLIPIYVVFVCFFNHKFSTRLYPVVIFLISISLLLLLSLRSNHIIGTDTHSEFYLFRITLGNLHWAIHGHTSLDACLSISLLPTIYHSILNIPSEILFKILYSLIYSISPLVIYIISKKYVGEMYGFLASCFFMFQANFLWTTANSRTSIAILFFALAMMVLFNDKIDPLKKRVLFIVFMASCIVSHYSTAYIFFFIMLGTFIGMEILSKKYTFKKILSLTLTILFFALIFFWYSQVTETAFDSSVHFVEETLTNLNKFFVAESRAEAFQSLAGQELPYPILSRANWVVTWCTFILIGIGVLTLIKRHKEMIDISNVKLKKPDFLKTKFEVGYFIITLACSGLLLAMVALPYVSTGYGIDRLYSMAITILSLSFVIGGITLSKQFFFKTFKKSFIKNASRKRKPVLKEKNNSFFGKPFFFKRRFDGENGSQVRAYLIILLILIPYSMFVTSAMHQIFGVGCAITLNSEGKAYDRYYVHDQECYGAKWLKDYAKQQKIYAVDWLGEGRLISQGMIPVKLIDRRSFFKYKKIDSYIYMQYHNVNGRIISVEGDVYNMTEYSNMFVGKNKICDNGGSEVWR